MKARYETIYVYDTDYNLLGSCSSMQALGGYFGITKEILYAYIDTTKVINEHYLLKSNLIIKKFA